MDQNKGSGSGILYSLKQKFWPNSMTKRSSFRERDAKLKIGQDHTHCNIASNVTDDLMLTHNKHNSPTPTNFKNVLSVSEPVIGACLLGSSENIQSSLNYKAICEELCFVANGSDRISHSVECETNLVTVGRTPPPFSSQIVNRDLPSKNICPYSNDNQSDKMKSGLMYELVKLPKYGWYWGSMTKEEAEEKLTDQPDGAFLLRDSSADHFILSLSFRSSGKTLHTRIEYRGSGLFSFYQQSDESFATIAELIEHSMSYSQSAVYCYSRSRSPGIPAFPVRLTKPVSRFAHVRSLQHLCRFVIRESIRLDNIQKLPLPRSIRGYLEESHY